jgi:hypothetical protein
MNIKYEEYLYAAANEQAFDESKCGIWNFSNSTGNAICSSDKTGMYIFFVIC